MNALASPKPWMLPYVIFFRPGLAGGEAAELAAGADPPAGAADALTAGGLAAADGAAKLGLVLVAEAGAVVPPPHAARIAAPITVVPRPVQRWRNSLRFTSGSWRRLLYSLP